MPAAPRTPRKPAGDIRAAKVQLRTADQDARVAKDARAGSDGDALTVRLREKDFRLADEVGIMPLMEWATASDTKGGLTAVTSTFYVLKDIVAEDEWADFRQYARDEKVTGPELVDFANAAFEALAGRPTVEPSGS